jgi:D-alanyl-lipoteichoic acid acyltransferase DltB (MBOAT superfamily)
MLLGGLWHGASWHFVAWGAYHGLILCTFRVLGIRDPKLREQPVRWFGRVLFMFHLTCLGWLLFRADTMQIAGDMLVAMFTIAPGDGSVVAPMAAQVVLFGLVPCLLELFVSGERNIKRLWAAPWWVQTPAYLYIGLMILFFRPGVSGEFIYFQF